MATAVNIVIADALGTPVNHTFIPVGLDKDGLFWFEDQSQANSLGFWRISAQLVRPKASTNVGAKADRVFKTKVALHEPILEVPVTASYNGIAPAPQISYVPRAYMEFIIPERSALIDRQNMAKMAPLLLQNAQIKAMIETFTYLQ
jgi:hypothetical protein